ncbi:hypothetical protein FRC12_023970 [Ceratobasidium sp. 428]|nr:hypothetical protein FRC09_015140 [Ceratobasidium sp. 395]KAG8725853.1 hypothetical protein FRC12_023970 [Ceratobasidium sp. 428]
MFHRLSLVVLALFLFFASIVRADFPLCSQPCTTQYTAAGCSATDNACMCRNASYCNQVNNCFRTSCNATDWKTAYNQGVSLCNAAGVTQSNIINPPPPKRDFVPVYYGRAVAA